MSELVGKFVDNAVGVPSRHQSRNSLFVKAMLRFPASSEQREIRVRNVSAGGLMAEATVRAGRGETVEVQLKNIGWVSGKVAWVADTRFGVAFDYPIDPKATHLPSASKTTVEDTMPTYLRKLNEQGRPPEPGKLRRL
jgi:PilZ domain